MQKTALIGGKLIDGNGGSPVENSLILIEGADITYAGPAIDIDESWRRIDAGGKTAVPGLIDSHLHFGGVLSDNDSDWVLAHPTQKTIIAVSQARESLYSGLTTVGEISRDGLHIRDMIAAGIIEGPRIVATGLGFCRTGGHGDSHLVSLSQNQQNHPWSEQVDGPWDLRRAVRRRLRESPDALKIWATGGGIWKLDRKDHSHYTMEEIVAVVEEANMTGLPVWSHAEGFQGALDSCRAGVRVIIHGQELNDECLDLMSEKGIFFCPTIQFLDEWFTVYEPPYRPVHDQYPGKNTVEKETARIYDNLRKARQKGIKITVGSDSFCSTLTPYGDTAIREMHTLARAGLSEMEILMAATKHGAEMLKVDDITGTLEPGKKADLLVLCADPLQDIHHLTADHMDVIMKEGAFVRNRLPEIRP